MSLLKSMFRQRTTTLDPICGRVVVDNSSGWVSEHHGDRYKFCSLTCKEVFDADPQLYLQAGRPQPVA